MKGDALLTVLGLGLVALLIAKVGDLATRLEQATDRDLTDVNNPTGGMADEWADRADDLSDAVDDAVRNEERYVGVPVSPYQ